MGKTIKLTEAELHKLIFSKLKEELEHNVDLEYSPAIGNKKRGPGDNSMDQMKKRRNTSLDEESIYRKLPDGDVDYEGETGGNEGMHRIELSEEAYAYAFKQVYGRVPNDLYAVMEYYGLPETVDIDFTLSDKDMDGNREIEDWRVDEFSLYGGDSEMVDIIKKAAEYEMENISGDELSGYMNESKKVRMTESQFHSFITESVKNVLSEAMEEGAIGNFFNRTFNGKAVRQRAASIKDLINKYENAFLRNKAHMTSTVKKLYSDNLGYLKKYYQRIANGENVPEKYISGIIEDLDNWLGRAKSAASRAEDAEMERIRKHNEEVLAREAERRRGGGSYGRERSWSSIYNPGGMGSAYEKYGMADDVRDGQRG